MEIVLWHVPMTAAISGRLGLIFGMSYMHPTMIISRWVRIARPADGSSGTTASTAYAMRSSAEVIGACARDDFIISSCEKFRLNPNLNEHLLVVRSVLAEAVTLLGFLFDPPVSESRIMPNHALEDASALEEAHIAIPECAVVVWKLEIKRLGFPKG